ncbi:MAG: transaldolase [Thermoleophilia bacterium]
MSENANPMLALEQIGQSVWIDYLSRDLIESGRLKKLMDEDGIKGVTSNPTIFQKAISGSRLYDASLQKAVADGIRDDREIFLRLEIEDIVAAADLLRPKYDASGGWDGFVSIETSPDLAYDVDATIREVMRLAAAVARKNVFIKVPATEAGPAAIEQLVSEGFNINVTLLFSVFRYRQVVEAYMSGLEKRLHRGDPIDGIMSVASFFVSRVDTLVDNCLNSMADDAESTEEQETLKGLMGLAAVANARLAYQDYKKICSSDRFQRLEAAGANKQRLLWASSSTKNPEYSDIKYIEELIAPETINTMTEDTIEAFRDHGQVRISIEDHLDEAHGIFDRLGDLGIQARLVGEQLEKEGVKAFSDSFHNLLDEIDTRKKQILNEAA